MARTTVLAAGGIVLRREDPARIALVRLRKRNEWVLPKGKLDDGETPRAAAEREVLEETGHDVSVHEFLGTLVYESGGRSKVVHYWRMEAGGGQVNELMHDVKAVDWLPLGDAVERLSRGYERRSRPLAPSEPLPAVLEAPPQQPELVPLMPNEPAMAVSETVELAMPALLPTEPGLASQEAPAALVLQSDVATRNAGTSVVKKVQDWLRRVRRPDRAAASGR